MSGLFERLDPRARILIVVAATVIAASTPPAILRPFAAYFVLSLLLIMCSRASGFYIAWRCMAASPFILLAAGLLAFQLGLPHGAAPALSVALKGYSAALLLAFLTATTPLGDLLWAMRKLKAPESLNVILGMMYRYTSLLSEEYARLERARECRTVKPLGRARYAIHGRQMGSLLLRSWDRADRVHAAMLSRGFNGSWPAMERRRQFGAMDAAFLGATILLFLAFRLAK